MVEKNQNEAKMSLKEQVVKIYPQFPPFTHKSRAGVRVCVKGRVGTEKEERKEWNKNNAIEKIRMRKEQKRKTTENARNMKGHEWEMK